MKLKIALCLALLASTLGAVDIVRVDVDVQDKFGGDTSLVTAQCLTKKGMSYDSAVVERDVRNLMSSGEFQTVKADAERSVDPDGIVVTFHIQRKMRFQAPLNAEGNDFFSVSKLLEESGLKDGDLYSEGDFATAAGKVKQAYAKKHFHQATVLPVIQLLPGGNSCHVKFVVNEGPQLKTHDFAFSFKGQTEFDQEALRTAIGVYPWWNPIGWFSNAPTSDEELAQAAEKIRQEIANLGYLDAQVDDRPMRVPVEGGKADIVYQVDEGPLYRIGETRIEGVTHYKPSDVAEKSNLPAKGDVAGEKAIEDAAHRVMVTVGSGDSGLADTRVEVKRIPQVADPHVVDVVYQVTEGVPVVINDVVIEGNDYTKDKVIRREIALGPGDRMLEDRAERSQKRLENLNYFSRVRYSLRPTDRGVDDSGAEYRDLVYEVEERNTGSFMVGLGASSVDSIYFSAEVSQSNFDLFAPKKFFRGGGQKGRLYAQVGPRIQTYEAAVTEPYLFDRLLELTVEGYRRQRWYDEYDLVRNGVAATLAYPVKFWPTANPFGRLGFRVSTEFLQMDDVEDKLYYKNDKGTGPTAPIFRDEEREYGDAFEQAFRIFWSHDNRDNFRIATRGGRTYIFGDVVVGDNNYWRLGASHRHYFPVFKDLGHVLMCNVRAETIDAMSDDVPIYNRMFLGGPRSIRGVKYRNVAPLRRPAAGDEYAPWGGQTLACVNFEYTLPVVKMLRLAVFTDLGAVGEDTFDFDFSDNFAWTAGIGIRLDIPMFPIRLDFAAPIEKPDNAEKEVFSFTVGFDF